MQSAIGRARSQIDPLDPARAQALHATLGLSGPTPVTGDQLPPFWHYIYFWEAQPPQDLGRDGHPKTGGFIPDTGLPRRMWAGGALEFFKAPKLGLPAERVSKITAIDKKQGRSGALAVVTLDHELSQNGILCVRERQDLIYREDADPNAAQPVPVQAPTDDQHSRLARFDSTLLFRYSALTFNGHRIHYDRDYCQTVEGYPGLVTHGPLLAQMLIHFAVDLLGTLRTFEFRATSPLFDFEAATLCAKNEKAAISLWVRGPDGRLCMSAKAS